MTKTKNMFEEVLKNMGFEKKGDGFLMPEDENGNTMEAVINGNTLEIVAENKNGVSAKGRIDLDDIVKCMAEGVLRTVNDEIERLDIECLEKIEFENDVDLLTDIGKAAEAGDRLLKLLKAAGAKDAYMSGKLAVFLSDLPCYEAVKTDESMVKTDRLVGSVSGINVHIYSNLPWDNNTVYYK